MHIYTHDYIRMEITVLYLKISRHQFSRQIYPTYLENRTWQLWSILGDNCIVFENFTASVGDLMVANWVNGYLRPWNRQFRWCLQIFGIFARCNILDSEKKECSISGKFSTGVWWKCNYWCYKSIGTFRGEVLFVRIYINTAILFYVSSCSYIFSFVVDLIFPVGLMYSLNEPHRWCNSDRAHIRCGTLWLHCIATERNGNSISADITDDTIENNKNDACFSYFWTIWLVFWTFWYWRINKIK
jgi:hypothetical protein